MALKASDYVNDYICHVSITQLSEVQKDKYFLGILSGKGSKRIDLKSVEVTQNFTRNQLWGEIIH